MDYEEDPSLSRQNSILVYQSTSSKNYRVSSRAGSSVGQKPRGLNSTELEKKPKRKEPQVLIKKSTTKEEDYLGGGRKLSFQPPKEMNFLDVPGRREEPSSSKGFFSKQKKVKQNVIPRELSAPSPGHRPQRQSLSPQERSQGLDFGSYPENRMTINFAVSPRLRSSDIDVGLTLHLGGRREQASRGERSSQEKAGERKGSSSRGRKYP